MRAFEPAAIDPSIDPCEDFYQFACGGWEQASPRPETVGLWSRPWGQYAEDVDRFNRELIQFIAENPEPGDVDQENLARFFQSCRDTDAIDARGMESFAGRVELIDSMVSARDVARVLGELTAFFGADSPDPLFDIYSWGDPVEGGSRRRGFVTAADGRLPAREYYEENGDDPDGVLGAYRAYLQTMLELVGYDAESRTRLADEILLMESRLQSARRSAAEERNDAQAEMNLMTLEQLGEAFPNLNWAELLEARAYPLDDALVVPDQGYVAEVDRWIVDANVELLRAYFKLFALRDVDFALPMAGRQATHALYGEVLSGLEEPRPRWQTCVAATESTLPEALGRAFVAATLAPGVKEQSKQVFEAIQGAMERRILGADWLQPETREAALAKLAEARTSLAHPDSWVDDRSLRVDPNDLVATSARFGAARRQRGAEAVGEPLDINDWFYPTTRVIGFFTSSTNTVFMSASQLLYFGVEADDPAVLYGGLGVFLAHELSHGFDSHGSQYDARGRVRNWWADSDRAEFEARAQCLIDEANELTYPSGDAVNGELIVSEHGAEVISVGLALDALETVEAPDETVDGYSALQRFFLTNAQLLCYQASDEAWRQIATSDSHLWGPPGVNSVVANTPAFAEAFNCSPESAAVKPAEDVCRVW